MSSALDTAASAFWDALQDLGLAEGDSNLGDAAAFGRRAALLAAADLLWRRHLGTLLSTREVQQLLGGCTRQAVSDAEAQMAGEVAAAAMQLRQQGDCNEVQRRWTSSSSA
jgi:hypothetical protein